MTHDAWPSSDEPPEPLPRVEDLPVADRGYDQEAVREAFDTFYRHAAQLDVSLRALEAVEVFRRDADALRNDLRALRALGYGGGVQEPAWAAQRYDVPRSDVPLVVLRLAAEAALIVTVAVIAGVAHFRPIVVVALMAAAFLIVAISEWLAGRARFVPPAIAYLPAAPEGEPAPYVEARAPVWGVTSEPDEETEPEALTIVASAEEVEVAAAASAVDPWERGPSIEAPDAEGPGADAPAEAGAEPTEAEDEPERAGLFRRRRR
jgi:hypothetical protein